MNTIIKPNVFNLWREQPGAFTLITIGVHGVKKVFKGQTYERSFLFNIIIFNFLFVIDFKRTNEVTNK